MPLISGGSAGATIAPNRASDHFKTGYTNPAPTKGVSQQNTNSTAMHVIVFGNEGSSTHQVKALVEDVDPPTAAVARSQVANDVNGKWCISFMVPPGFYWMIDDQVGTLATITAARAVVL